MGRNAHKKFYSKTYDHSYELVVKNIFVCVLKYDPYYIPTVFVPSDTINAARIEPVSNPALLTKV